MMNTVGVFVLVILSFVDVHTYTPFRFTDCSRSGANNIVNIDNVEMVNYPVRFPGEVRVSASVHVRRPLTYGLRLDVSVEKYVLFDYFAVPCVYRVGSCAYDFCGLLDWFSDPDRGCPWQLLVSDNFPCYCTLANGTYTLQPYPFNIPRARGAWQWIAFGDYRITGRLVDEATGDEVGCYTVEFTTQSEPDPETSWFWDW